MRPRTALLQRKDRTCSGGPPSSDGGSAGRPTQGPQLRDGEPPSSRARSATPRRRTAPPPMQGPQLRDGEPPSSHARTAAPRRRTALYPCKDRSSATENRPSPSQTRPYPTREAPVSITDAPLPDPGGPRLHRRRAPTQPRRPTSPSQTRPDPTEEGPSSVTDAPLPNPETRFSRHRWPPPRPERRPPPPVVAPEPWVPAGTTLGYPSTVGASSSGSPVCSTAGTGIRTRVTCSCSPSSTRQ